MLAFLWLVALLPLPTWEYKIKVEGKLDIGNQIADFLQNLQFRIVQQRLRALRQGHKVEIDLLDETPKTKSPHTTRQTVRTNIPLLEEIINRGEKTMHVYGKHRKPQKKQKINVQI